MYTFCVIAIAIIFVILLACKLCGIQFHKPNSKLRYEYPSLKRGLKKVGDKYTLVWYDEKSYIDEDIIPNELLNDDGDDDTDDEIVIPAFNPKKYLYKKYNNFKFNKDK